MARQALDRNSIEGEVIVIDNGSCDESAEAGTNSGARVIPEQRKGYGNALRAGIEQARGTYIIMGDADGSYDLGNIMLFLDELRKGYDLVMGNRFAGGIEKDAMPLLNRYVGNPALSLLAGILYTRKVKDYACGQRAFTKKATEIMNLRTSGMEFAYEMVIRAHQEKLKITEVPVKLYRDKRQGKPKLRPWRDGFRTLRHIFAMKFK
jgi:glycosyltransferase involved in cell wall biosynthesis